MLRRALAASRGGPSFASGLLSAASARVQPIAAPLRLQQQVRGIVEIQKNVTAKNRLILSTKPGTLPHATLKHWKPTNPALRFRVTIDRSHIWPGRSEPKLTQRLQEQAGRGSHGRIMVRGRCSRKHRRKYRIIDFKRRRTDPAVVQRFEYDPNRSTFIALIRYECAAALAHLPLSRSPRASAHIQRARACRGQIGRRAGLHTGSPRPRCRCDRQQRTRRALLARVLPAAGSDPRWLSDP